MQDAAIVYSIDVCFCIFICGAIKNIKFIDRGPVEENVRGEERQGGEGGSVEGKEKHFTAGAGQKVQPSLSPDLTQFNNRVAR